MDNQTYMDNQMRMDNQTCIEHYFDWAATSPPDMDIINSANQMAATAWGNPSSPHSAGHSARALLEAARSRAIKALGVEDGTVYFTSGGTESDHIVLLSTLMRPNRGMVRYAADSERGGYSPTTVLVGGTEHSAVKAQAEALSRLGVNIAIVPPDKDGIITADAVMQSVTEQTVMVCVMAVNNETGAVSPVNKIAQAIHSLGGRHIWLHSDCVQALGKVPLDLSGVDSAAFSAHKISGPRGIGALYIAKDSIIQSFLRGGGQENAVRSGTENVAGALAMSECMARYSIPAENPANESTEQKKARNRYIEQCALTDKFIAEISKLPSCRIIPQSRSEKGATQTKWSPWIVQASFLGIPGQVMLRALDEMGYCISTGSACSSGKGNRPVLQAMGITGEAARSAVRFSFGHSTTAHGMEDLAKATATVVSRFGGNRARNRTISATTSSPMSPTEQSEKPQSAAGH